MERPFGHDVGPAGPTTWSASLLLSPLYPPSWLLNSLTHIAIQLPKFEFPIPNLVVENSLGRSSFGVREKGEKVESESVAKILSKREREVLLKFEQEREGLRAIVLSKSREKTKKN